MSSTEAPYSVTFKSRRGNLITVRADTAVEWMANLNEAASSGALGVIAQIETSLAGDGNPPAGQPQPAPVTPPPSNGGQNQQPQSQGSLNPACPTCGGPTVEKSGNSARGPWRGYFCQNSDKSAGHKVTWA